MAPQFSKLDPVREKHVFDSYHKHGATPDEIGNNYGMSTNMVDLVIIGRHVPRGTRCTKCGLSVTRCGPHGVCMACIARENVAKLPRRVAKDW